LNRVHVVTVHGWNFWDSTSDASQSFANLATESIRQVLDDNNLRGTELCVSPLSGCGPLPGDIENRQTIYDRVLGCLEELKANGGLDKLQKADLVMFAGHSQGAVVSVLLIDKLISAGKLQPHLGVQRVTLLSMAGVHHGTHEMMIESLMRDASRELKALQDPSSDLFREGYLPALVSILERHVIVIPVSSYGDKVVNLCSATMDGLQHKNIYRGCFVHEKYFSSDHPNTYHHDLLMSLWILVIRMRNMGRSDDLARFLTNPSLGSQAARALVEIGSLVGESYRDSPSTAVFEGTPTLRGVIAGLSFAWTMGGKILQDQDRLSGSKQLVRDADAHSVIHDSPATYRFGFYASIVNYSEDVPNGNLSDPPVIRPTFNKDPVDADWATFRRTLLSLEGSGLDQHLQEIWNLYDDKASHKELTPKLKEELGKTRSSVPQITFPHSSV